MTDQQKNDGSIDAKVLTGAMLLGAKDAIVNSLTDQAEAGVKLASQLIEPEDQRHILHPWENFNRRLLWTFSMITTPGDMNLQHSIHPIDAAQNAHSTMVTAMADQLTEKGLVEGVRSASAIATAVMVENVDPFKKLQIIDKATDAANALEASTINWNTYAALLGNGSQPPKLKPLRDFSGLMDYGRPQVYDEHTRLTYLPSDEHKMVMQFTHQWSSGPKPQIVHTEMEYLVKVNEGARQEYGSGAEMFHSALQLVQGHYGVRVDTIKNAWHHEPPLSANYDAFIKARADGATAKAAVNKTHGGHWAADAGFTEVGGRKFNYETREGAHPSSVHPEFTRPIFSDNKSYNDYGQAWASSQGRSRQDLVSRHEAVDASKVLPKLDLPLSGLTQEQADAFRQHIHDHIDKHFDALFSGRKIDLEVK